MRCISTPPGRNWYLSAALTGGFALTCACTGGGGTQSVEPGPELCVWDSSVEAGRLDPRFVNESSGLEVSTAFPNRLYHINDSGDAGRFYVTDLAGNGPRVVNIEGFDPVDVEDIALGQCGTGAGPCLFISDTGDNDRLREDVEIVVIEELAEFPDSVAPLDRIRLRYPEGAQDAESLAAHPNGDLYIITKAADYLRLDVQPSRIYRIANDVWRNADGRTLTPELVGAWDFSRISSDVFSGSLPTAADISDDGERLLVLTYTNAFEFAMASWTNPVSTREMVAGIDYREIEIETLEQQESIAYLPGGDAFLYATEDSPGSAFPRIMEVRCGI